MSRIEDQARYYRNLPLRDRSIKAVVHLEDAQDKTFWNYQLQNAFPAKYLFLTYSKNENGNDTRGCEQCLRYIPYLTKRFFVCIDSDLRQLKGEMYSADDFVAQTYTYSWENHFCEAVQLQKRFVALVPDAVFDFRIFLRNLSKVLYRPLLYLVHFNQSAETNKIWNITKFNDCLPLQPKRDELEDNGSMYIKRVSKMFDNALQGFESNEPSANKYVSEDNAYLHIQGHHIYKLVLHIGTLLCRGTDVAFRSDVLDKAMQTTGYEEIDNVRADLMQILTSD